MKIKAPVLRRVREPMEVVELDLDEPKAGEVLVRMAASGVCHSCLHAADGSWAGALAPIVLGDEGAGVVERAGPGVTHVQPGDHIVVAWTPTCGRCHYCAVGRSNLCDARGVSGYMPDGTVRFHLDGQDVYHFGTVGTYASHIVIGATNAIKIPGDVPLDVAALIGCSVMTGVGAVLNTAKVPAGASLAIFGCGGVGLNAVQGGRLVSAEPLIAVDISDEKLRIARQLGATVTLNPTRDDVPAEIKTLTGRGVDYAVVTVGSAAATHQAWECVARGGTCVVVGLGRSDEPLQLDPRHLVLGERALVGSVYGSARPLEDFPRLLGLYKSGKLKIDELITRRYRLEEAEQAHRDLASGALARGVIVF